MALSDIMLECSDCSVEFPFTVGEQEFFASRGFTNYPKRCQPCRNARRGQSNSGYGGQRESFAVVCSNCGADATVPFRPRGDRPVYCSDCFSQMRNS